MIGLSDREGGPILTDGGALQQTNQLSDRDCSIIQSQLLFLPNKS